MDGTATRTAEAVAHEINEAEREARRQERAAGDARNAARSAMYAAEEAERVARVEIGARSAELVALLRALAHRDEDAPHEEPSENVWRKERVFAATFGRVLVYESVTSGTARAVEAWIAGGDDMIYRSAHGTNDPAKLAREWAAAVPLAEERARDLTAAAWLRAHGIDPAEAPDPSTLVEPVAFVRRDTSFWQGRPVAYWIVTWRLRLRSTGEIIEGFEVRNLWDLIDRLYPDTAREERAAMVEAQRLSEDATREAAQAWADARNADAVRVMLGRA